MNRRRVKATALPQNRHRPKLLRQMNLIRGLLVFPLGRSGWRCSPLPCGWRSVDAGLELKRSLMVSPQTKTSRSRKPLKLRLLCPNQSRSRCPFALPRLIPRCE